MLQTIRDRAQGWIAWAIVILITIPFALFGIHEYFGVGAEPVKVSINDREITESDFEKSYRQYRQRLVKVMGDAYRPELVDETKLREQVLNIVIRNELILQTADRIGLRVSEAYVHEFIRRIPVFHEDGEFNQSLYEQNVRRMGMTLAGFVAQTHQDMVTDQVHEGITNSALVTDAELADRVRLELQQREFDYLEIPATDFLGQVTTEAAEVDAYYQSHQQEFMSPEQVKLEYVELDIKNMVETLEVDEETLLDYYERNKNDYRKQEQRRAGHILIGIGAAGDAAAVESARSRAEAALKRVRDGEAFAAVAKEVSEDPGSKSAGGDLGYFGKEVMDPVFEEAVFSMSAGEVSGLVQTDFGFHIIQLNDIRPGGIAAFEEVRERVASAYRQNEAEQLFYDYRDKLANLAWEEKDSLLPAAEALGLTVRESDWIGRDGGAGILSSSKVTRAAFGDDVLVQGNNSEVIELGAEHVMVLRAVEHREASLKPLDSVQEQIIAGLQQEKAAARAATHGKGLIEKLQAGETLQSIAAAESKQPVTAGAVLRSSSEVPQPIRSTLFRLPRPAGEQPEYGSTVLDNGNFVIIALRSVTEGSVDVLDQREKRSLRQGMQASFGQIYLQHFVDNERDAATIVIPSDDD
jgi:peptidyl-prolyl cis-trans isomerase D